MQFSKEQNLTFEQAVEKMFEKLGDSKIMALASAVGTHVMVRNVSCLFYNNKIYFKTDKNFRKTQQLFENPNVALCWSGVQVEGVAENNHFLSEDMKTAFTKAEQQEKAPLGKLQQVFPRGHGDFDRGHAEVCGNLGYQSG